MNQLSLFALILSVIIGLTACSKNEPVSFNLINPTDSSLKDAPVVITRAQLSVHADFNRFPIVLIGKNQTIPSQADDIDGDGLWDELAFVIDISAKDTLSISVDFTKEISSYKAYTNIRMAEKKGSEIIEIPIAYRLKSSDTKIISQVYQMEGPAWENDKVAFRNYLDVRNGMDIFGKIKPDLVMDKVGIDDDYHKLNDWGMDILKVGSSLGSGGMALVKDNKFYGIGSGDSSYVRVITEGCVRAMLDLVYPKVVIENETISISDRIIIWKGQYAFDSEILVSGSDSLSLITGIVNLHSDTCFAFKEHSAFCIATHDAQSFINDTLGMAIITRVSDEIIYSSMPEEGDGITQTYYIQKPVVDQEPFRYRFFACWEKTDKHFANRTNFLNFLKSQSYIYSNPILVHFKK